MTAVLGLLIVPASLFAITFGMAWVEDFTTRHHVIRMDRRGPVGR